MGEEVLVLIDSGETHNFIATELVDELGLPVLQTRRYEVTVGDGHKVQSSGVCRKIILEIQGLHIKQPFYLFGLGGADVVLGIDWLQSLGEVKVNWGLLTMKVRQGSEVICLQGDPALTKAATSLKSLMVVVKGGGEGFLIEFREMAVIESTHEEVDEGVQKLLEEFADTCEVGTELPPRRKGDHAIAFEELKHAMTTLPVLAMPDLLPFEIETDASGSGIGAVLMQKGRPIAFYRQVLSKKSQQCSVYERELMAVVLAVKRWNHYLMY
ncbi:tryptophan--trna ligase, cytoplasmic [Senna tora]|uniref:Tryptophan--trna ligase, cytoplasmic n=1 Tax=Senna tora TaxID=362788 RepID=A0A834WB32_9FABA|nr:tryptophan--trna ligase, cytoplasmic [Senna tora]